MKRAAKQISNYLWPSREWGGFVSLVHNIFHLGQSWQSSSAGQREGVRSLLIAISCFALLSCSVSAADLGTDPAPYYWIYLAPRPAKAFDGEKALGSRAIMQRERQGIGAKPSDYPVWAPWLDELVRMGVEARVTSRYFHAVTAPLGRDLYQKVKEMPFVERIIPVHTGRLRSHLPMPYQMTPIGSHNNQEPQNEPMLSTETPFSPITILGRPTDYGASFGQLAMLGIPDLHSAGLTGQGVLIAILDSGFHKDHYAFNHLDIIGERDFIDGDNQTQNYDPSTNPGRGDYHGTYSLSALAGLVPGHLVGPAYNASFLLARSEILEEEARLEEDAYVAALEWASAEGAQIVSTSLGYWAFIDDAFVYPPDSLDGYSTVTTRAVNIAFEEGLLVVTSAGNKGPGESTLLAPGDSPNALAIGAVTPWRSVTSFSSRGPTFDGGRIKPDLCAQGKYTVCAQWEPLVEPALSRANGTSLAAPLVSGLAALILEAHPDWSADSLLINLRRSGNNATTPDMARGFGIPWGPLASNLGGATIVVDSLYWSVPPRPGEIAELSIQLLNRGQVTSEESSLRIFDAAPGLTVSDNQILVPSLSPGETTVVGNWEISFSGGAGSDSDRWAWLTCEIEAAGSSSYRWVGWTMADPQPIELVKILSLSPSPWYGWQDQLTVEYGNPHQCRGDLNLLDVTGRVVAHLVSGAELSGGRGRLEINAEMVSNIPSGSYYLQLRSIYGQSAHPLVRLR